MEAKSIPPKSEASQDPTTPQSAPVLDGATTGLVMQMMRVLNLYSDIYGLISTEDKETETHMRQYGEVFSATEKSRIADIHTDLVMSAFRDRPHAYIGMPHLLKKRIASLALRDIELGSNLFDANGNPKKKGVYFPLGPVWRMATKLRERAKQIMKAGSDKIEKTDLMHTGMHQIFQLVIQHLEPLMEDEKATRSCKHAISWYHEYRVLCKSEGGETPSFSDAIGKMRGLVSGPLIKQIISQAGLGNDIDEGEIEGIFTRFFGDENSKGGGLEEIFGQISSGEIDPNDISSMVSKIANLNPEDTEEDSYGEDDREDDDFDDYEEVVTYEDVD